MALSHNHNHSMMDKWSDQNRDVGLLLLRIVLGGVLILKGYRFLFHTTDITSLLNSFHQTPFSTALVWVVIFANIAGGLFILMGIFTRIVCLIQIPILIGAMLINMVTHLLNSSEWLLAFVTFFLIVYLYIYGIGKYSIQHLLLDDIDDEEF